LGERIRNISFAFAAYSLYGLIPILLGNAILLSRIGIEERMLAEEFGVEYEEYRNTTITAARTPS
jgi:protein-S-isoprenylcysteine O-methyltransferase Ste14